MTKQSLVALVVLSGGCPAPAPPPPKKPVLVAAPKPEPPRGPCLENAREIEVPGWPSTMTVGRLDGDDNIDVVVNYLATGKGEKGHRFQSLRGDGELGFSPYGSGELGDFTSSIRLVDLDGDGDGDIIANDFRRRQIRIVPGAANGHGKAFVIKTADNPSGVDAIDVDGDGNLDILVSGLRTIELLSGDGRLGFRKQRTLAVKQAPDRVVVFDSSGATPTLATVGNDSATLFMLAASGRGLAIKREAATCPSPSKTQTADVDGDGALDILYHCRGSVEIQLGGTSRVTATQIAAEDLAVGDFDGDGVIEIFVTSRPSLSRTRLHYLKHQGGGVFEQLAQTEVEGHLSGLAGADLDGDGKDDLVALRWPGVEPGIVAVWSANLCPAAPAVAGI